MTDTSLSLLDRARSADDGDSWRQLAAVYVPVLHAWLRRYDIQAADADDLVQDVLLILARELPQFEHNGRPGAFRGWLRMILVHRLRDFWRRRQYRPVASGGSDFLRQLDQLEDPHSQLSEQWNREHDRHLLRQLLEQIEPRFQESTRVVFRRLAIDGIEPGQVAEDLGLTLNAVLIAKSRVLKELRREGAGLLGE
ncbi:MAG TPA: RNA polymerase sigma factor [Planctomycetaceae bacterium]|nr:RNA polymerase sigma factor [Planctomycetaceae bacterium]